MDIDVPDAQFELARLHLNAGRIDTSLDAYARAVEVWQNSDSIRRELASVNRILAKWQESDPPEGKIGDSRSVQRFLALAAVARSDPNEAHRDLDPPLEVIATRGSDRPAFDHRPVVIVAGGCAGEVEKSLVERYGTTLRRALENFEGTLICGGTNAGVSRIVADLPEKHAGTIRKIGYLPARETMSSNDQERVDAYKIVRTSGSGYTPLGPIQTWADILAAGLKPSAIRVLGVSGGVVAAFEYRLGLALGAKVGVVKESGRAASELLLDASWKKAKWLVSLPNDPAAITAFLGIRAS